MVSFVSAACLLLCLSDLLNRWNLWHNGIGIPFGGIIVVYLLAVGTSVNLVLDYVLNVEWLDEPSEGKRR